MKIEHTSEKVTRIDRIPLRLSFEPDAIREHFDGEPTIDGASDEELYDIAARCLEDDELCHAFNAALRRHALAVLGVELA